MGGIGSGPQKTPSTLIKEAKENDVKNLPRYFERLSELALSGDREALVYLVDRHLGKNKQSIEVDTGDNITFNAVALFTLLIDQQKRLNEPIIEIEEVDNGQDSNSQAEETP